LNQIIVNYAVTISCFFTLSTAIVSRFIISSTELQGRFNEIGISSIAGLLFFWLSNKFTDECSWLRDAITKSSFWTTKSWWDPERILNVNIHKFINYIKMLEILSYLKLAVFLHEYFPKNTTNFGLQEWETILNLLLNVVGRDLGLS